MIPPCLVVSCYNRNRGQLRLYAGRGIATADWPVSIFAGGISSYTRSMVEPKDADKGVDSYLVSCDPLIGSRREWQTAYAYQCAGSHDCC